MRKPGNLKLILILFTVILPFACSDGGGSSGVGYWEPVASDANAPTARTLFSLAWVGDNKVFIWGGMDTNISSTNSGAVYDLVAETWTPTSLDNCPEPKTWHTTVWTGSEVIVWGGGNNTPSSRIDNNTGGIYDPVTDTWTRTSTDAGCPHARESHSAVWTGSEMIIWGGSYKKVILGNGSFYDPALDSWTELSNGVNCPCPRRIHSAVWTDDEMIVWGGVTKENGSWISLDNGAVYDPVLDSWTAMSNSGDCPAPRWYHTAVWTGQRMIIWGGKTSTDEWLATGAIYNPDNDSWTAISTKGAPPPVEAHTAVWTGSKMIVWGGSSNNRNKHTDRGGIYDPATDTWESTTRAGSCPCKRESHKAAWTGSSMFVWGGRTTDDLRLSDGAVYTPE